MIIYKRNLNNSIYFTPILLIIFTLNLHIEITNILKLYYLLIF